MNHIDTANLRRIALYFDPVCPWTYIVSKWLRNVNRLTGIPLEFRPFSLKMMNQGNEISEINLQHFEAGLDLLRVVAELREFPSELNRDLISNLYNAFGIQFHEEKVALPDLKIILDKHGISNVVQTTQRLTNLDSQILLEMRHALTLAGENVGVPIVVLEYESTSRGFFGPVLSHVPSGSDTLILWDHVIGLSAFECFVEIKRKRSGGAQVI